MYMYAPVDSLPRELQSSDGFENLNQLGGDHLDSASFWSGPPNMSSPLHYDLAHNCYLQIFGQKRFLLFPHNNKNYLYLHSRLHPSTRSSFLDVANVPLQKFPAFNRALSLQLLHPQEVVLNPGDVLYLPPYVWHRASVVGEEMSMSLAVYSTSTAMKVYDVFKSFPVPVSSKWSWSRRIAGLRVYVCALIDVGWTTSSSSSSSSSSSDSGDVGGAKRSCVDRVRKLLEQSYHPLGKEEKGGGGSGGGGGGILRGWNDWTKKHRRHFVWLTSSVANKEVPTRVNKHLVRHVSRLREQVVEVLEQNKKEMLTGDVMYDTETMSLIEDIVNYIVGTMFVEPFFRWMVGDLVLWR